MTGRVYAGSRGNRRVLRAKAKPPVAGDILSLRSTLPRVPVTRARKELDAADRCAVIKRYQGEGSIVIRYFREAPADQFPQLSAVCLRLARDSQFRCYRRDPPCN